MRKNDDMIWGVCRIDLLRRAFEMRKLLAVFVLLGVTIGVQASRAEAAAIQLFRNSKGTQFIPGCGFSGYKKVRIDFTQHKFCWNNSARAVRIIGPLRAGTRIRLFASNKGSGKFAWLDIAVRRPIPAGARLYIPNLERGYTGYFLQMKFHVTRDIGALNGNVSRLEIYPGRKRAAAR